MRIRFYNALIAPMDGREPFKGELWTEGERIAFCDTKEAAAKAGRFDEEIDLEGNLLLPAFKNAHTHSAMTFLRSFADDLPLMDWLHKQVFPMEAKLCGEDVYWLSTLAIMEYLSSGISANFDMYMFTKENVQASIDAGFRTVLCAPLNDFVGSVEQVEEEYLHYNQLHELIRFRLGFHAEYTCSRELLEKLAALAQRLKAPVYTHNSETLAEVQGCIKRHGMSPTLFLDSLGLFAYGGGAYHCVHLSREDMEVFRKRGLYLISNPGSNVKLASGIAPLQEYVDFGIRVALGTDGPASNNALDMFREMYLATALQKVSRQDAAALPAQEVLKMACCTGADAMGLEEADNLSAGKLADLTVLDLQKPNMQPLNHILDNVVYSGSKDNVCLTMVNGKILYRKGVFVIGKDPKEVYERANAIIERMRKQ